MEIIESLIAKTAPIEYLHVRDASPIINFRQGAFFKGNSDIYFGDKWLTIF